MAPKRKSKSKPKSATRSRKTIVREYFRLVGQGRFQDGLRFFADDCVTHNPYFAGTMGELANGQGAASRDGASMFPDPAFRIEHVLEDGSLVAAHTVLLGSRPEPASGGLRQVHLFRFKGDKIVEYWDVTQSVTKDQPNAAGAF